MMRVKYCNYCKGHDIEVLEKDHRNKCPYKLCACPKCEKNYKKTLNVNLYRQRKAQKNISDDGVLVINAAVKKGIHDYLVFKNELIKSSESLTIMVYPYNYPQVMLFQKNVDELNSLIDNEPSTEMSSRFQYRIVEKGAWKVVCLNKETRDRFLCLVKGITITPRNSNFKCPMFAIPENDVFKHLYMSCIVSDSITGKQFLLSVASNNHFDTSRWECDDSIPVEGGHKVNFAVDPIVYRYMLTNDMMLSVGSEKVEAKLELNPFLACMFEECS